MTEIVVKTEITEADERAVREPLRAHNRMKTGFKGPNGELALLIHDDSGNVTGGLTARYGYQWMGIELLFVPEAERGKRLGTRLMQQVESIARDNSLTGIWLDTFAFQARGFYEKLGFSVFGEITDYPVTHSRYFMQKRLS